MLSIICVYNNKKVLEDCLIKSLNEQKNNNSELILIDNSSQGYNNIIDAYEAAIEKCTGEYFVFVHQDITFLDKNVIAGLEKSIKNIKNFGILGVAGYKDKNIVSNIYHGVHKERAGTILITEPVNCDSVDECLFIIKRNTYNKYKFNKKLIDGWHLYAVEYCLNMRKNNLPVYVIPCNLYHSSSGASFDKTYYTYLRKVAKEYKKYFKTIGTTVGLWYTNPILLEIKILIRKIKLKLKMI